MTRSELLEKMRAKAVDLLDVKPADFVESASLVEDLEVDSLDIVEYVMALEDELGIELPEKELDGAQSIGDLLDVVEKKLAAES